MKTIWINDTAYQRTNYLIRKGANFVAQDTSSSQMIKTPENAFLYSQKIIPRRYLYLFKEIKDHASLQIEQQKINLSTEGIKARYFLFKNVNLAPGECLEFQNVIQYDINKAYYTIARNLGIISTEYYEKYINLPKHLRLVLIGGLATKKIIKNYENGILTTREIKEDENLRKAFIKIVVETDKILLSIAKALSNEFLVYWVDGITLIDTPKAKEVIEYYSALNNIEFSIEKLKFVRFQNEETLKAYIHNYKKEKVLINRKEYNGHFNAD